MNELSSNFRAYWMGCRKKGFTRIRKQRPVSSDKTDEHAVRDELDEKNLLFIVPRQNKLFPRPVLKELP